MQHRHVLGIRHCTWIWLIMIGLTIVTYFIGRFEIEGLGVSLLVLGFALLKGQMVGDYFMGLRRLSGFWRWPVSLWLFLPGTLISIAFVLVS